MSALSGRVKKFLNERELPTNALFGAFPFSSIIIGVSTAYLTKELKNFN